MDKKHELIQNNHINYIKTKYEMTSKYEYMYLDIPQFISKQMFKDAKLRVEFNKNQFKRKGTEYRIIFCTIRKKDEQKFIEIMDELKKKILIMGHNDYLDVCEYAINLLQEIH